MYVHEQMNPHMALCKGGASGDMSSKMALCISPPLHSATDYCNNNNSNCGAMYFFFKK